MNRIFLPLFLAALFAIYGCRKEENLFRLTGDINGLKDSTVLLYGLFSIPDSIVEIPVKDGKFSYTLPLDTITPMCLLLESSRLEYPIFANKGVDITVKGDTVQLNRLSITGGVAQAEYNAFLDSIADLKTYVDIRQEADSFIVKHPQSVVSIYLIQKYFVQVPFPNKNLIETMIKQLSGNMHDNHYISRLQNQLSKQPKLHDKRLQMLELPDTTGTIVKTDDYKDHFVVLSFWASWHPESVEWQDSLQQSIKKFSKRAVKFVSLSLDNSREAWADTIRDHKLKGIHLCDFKGWGNALVKETDAQDIPVVYVINTSNKIIATDILGKPLENLLDKQLQSWEEQQKKKKAKERARKKQQK